MKAQNKTQNSNQINSLDKTKLIEIVNKCKTDYICYYNESISARNINMIGLLQTLSSLMQFYKFYPSEVKEMIKELAKYL
jgi:hypothetical protein